ncbi:MAG: ABC transporter permease [Gemmobacter sp.]
MTAAARAAAAVCLAWLAVCAACFALFRLTPGDPAAIYADRAGVAGAQITAELRAAWGLDHPPATQFADWLLRALGGDAGLSFEDRRPIADDFARRLPWSAAVGAGGLALGVVLAVALGFAAALRPGGPADWASRALAVMAQALPAFAVGLVVLWVVAVEARLIRPLTAQGGDRLVLPILLVALFSAGSLARVVRAAFAEVRAAQWFRTALAKGLSARAALWSHGARHMTLSLIASLVPEAAWVVGGTAVAEIVFGVPGLSERVVAAVAARDYPVLQAYAALVAALMLTVRLAARLTIRRLDPRPAA